MTRAKGYGPLVADGDLSLISRLQSDPSYTEMNPCFAGTRSTTRRLLSDPKRSYSAILIGFGRGFGLEMIQKAHALHPGVPIFTVEAPGYCRFSEAERTELAIQGMIQRPMLASNFSLICQNLPSPEIMPIREAMPEDRLYVPVKVSVLGSATEAMFDFYHRMPRRGRYLRIIKKGEWIEPRKLHELLTREVSFLYIQEADRNRFLDRCERLLDSEAELMMTAENRQSLLFEFCQQLEQSLTQKGVSAEFITQSRKVLATMNRLLDRLALKQTPEFREMLKNAARLEHGTMTAVLAGVLTSHPELHSRRFQFLASLGAFLHDIGLQRVPERIRHGDFRRMDVGEQSMYILHPTLGAELLSKIQGMDPVVVQAIAQHHERRNGRGYPKRLAAADINRVSEVVGFSDELAGLLEKEVEGEIDNALEEMRARLPQFSSTLAEAYEEIFLGKKSRRLSSSMLEG